MPEKPKRNRYAALPKGETPRLMPLDTAAAYTSFSEAKFLKMVKAGEMPKEIRHGGSVRWDRRKLDAAIDALADTGEENPWDKRHGHAQAAGRDG